MALTEWPSQGAMHLSEGWGSLAAALIAETPSQEFPLIVSMSVLAWREEHSRHSHVTV